MGRNPWTALDSLVGKEDRENVSVRERVRERGREKGKRHPAAKATPQSVMAFAGGGSAKNPA
jgi:hypothetical protein